MNFSVGGVSKYILIEGEELSLELIYITNNAQVALIAEQNGVDYVMIDLETLGKEERQKNMDTVKSHHSISDIETVSAALTKSKTLVRINPINADSEREIEAVIAAGADMIMLPMWKTVKEVSDFLAYVNGRVKTMLLLETKEAVECLDEILEIARDSEIHIGLNDLHLSYGLTFMFELLSNGTVEGLCKKMNAAGVKYGFGGIARIGEGTLPAEKIVMEHYRLGSERVILSRSFCNALEIIDLNEIQSIFEKNIISLRSYEETLANKTLAEYEENKKAVQQCVESIAQQIKERKVR